MHILMFSFNFISRFRSCSACQIAVQELLVNSPELVTDLPEALSLMLGEGKILEEKAEVNSYFEKVH